MVRLMESKGLDTLVRFSAILYLPFAFTAHQVSSEKGSTLKGKNKKNAPNGANSFLLE